MVFCRHCGKELKDGDLFCSSCGTSVNRKHNCSYVKSDIDLRKYLKLIMKPAESLFYMANSINDAISISLIMLIPAVYGVISILLSKYVSHLGNSFMNFMCDMYKNYKNYGKDYITSDDIHRCFLGIFIFMFILTFVIILFRFLGTILFAKNSGKKYRMIIWKGTITAEVFMVINFVVFLLLSSISINLALIIYILEASVVILSFYIYLLKNLSLSETKTAVCVIMGYVFDILLILGIWELFFYIINNK